MLFFKLFGSHRPAWGGSDSPMLALMPSGRPTTPNPREAQAWNKVLAVNQRSGPVDPGATLGRRGDLAAAAKLFRPPRHISQSAATLIVVGHATTVVNDVEGEHVTH